MTQVRELGDLPRFRSIRDHRKRTDLVNTGAIVAKHLRADMITYQPGDTAARHYHKDADHLFIVTEGEGILHAGEESFHMKKDSVALVEMGEIHWFENPTQAEFTFLEFWTPPPTQTVWVDEGDQ